MSRYSVQEFIQKTAQQDKGQGLFELESERILELNLNGMAWIKKGSMVAYRGNVRFTREAILHKRSNAEIRDLSRSKGMQTLEQSAINKVLGGITTIEEMHRVMLAG